MSMHLNLRSLKPLLLIDTTWMEKWWIPINWACHHVKKEQISGGHLPKEGKEVASALIKFNQNLELVAEYKHNPLPALASQAVHFVFWGSMFFAAFCIEPTNFDVIGWRGFLLVSSIIRDHSYIMYSLVGGEGGSENANFYIIIFST